MHGTDSHRHEVVHPGDGHGKRLAVSIGLNLLITIAEVVGGILSGSLALLSDALHNFNDTVSQAISYAARFVARKDADSRLTFGYGRFEVVAAFFNLVTLFLVALLLAKEGFERLFDPQPVRGGLMLAVAAAGLLVNVLSALLLRGGARHSLNIKSAYLHIVTDAISSVAVIAGAILVVQFGFRRVDPVLTILISVYIMVQGYGMLRKTIGILMNSTPPWIDLDEVTRTIAETEGVRETHHVHVWLMEERSAALEAHVVIDREDMEAMEGIKHRIKERLESDFGIRHSTLEFEHEGIVDRSNCEDVHGSVSA